MELRGLTFSIQGSSFWDFLLFYAFFFGFQRWDVQLSFCFHFPLIFGGVDSAVDQFRKQFAHLEENGGKSGPVIPLERKHVSLPR